MDSWLDKLNLNDFEYLAPEAQFLLFIQTYIEHCPELEFIIFAWYYFSDFWVCCLWKCKQDTTRFGSLVYLTFNGLRIVFSQWHSELIVLVKNLNPLRWIFNFQFTNFYRLQFWVIKGIMRKKYITYNPKSYIKPSTLFSYNNAPHLSHCSTSFSTSIIAIAERNCI